LKGKLQPGTCIRAVVYVEAVRDCRIEIQL